MKEERRGGERWRREEGSKAGGKRSEGLVGTVRLADRIVSRWWCAAARVCLDRRGAPRPRSFGVQAPPGASLILHNHPVLKKINKLKRGNREMGLLLPPSVSGLDNNTAHKLLNGSQFLQS